MHFCITGQYTPQAVNSMMENPSTNRSEVAKIDRSRTFQGRFLQSLREALKEWAASIWNRPLPAIHCHRSGRGLRAALCVVRGGRALI